MEYKILQIIPADGWYVDYSEQYQKASLTPLICWALVEKSNGERSIVPMDVDGSAEGFIIHKSKIKEEV